MKSNIFDTAMMAAFLRPKWRLLETVTLAEAAASIEKVYTTGYKGFLILASVAVGPAEEYIDFTIMSGEATIKATTIDGLINTSAQYAGFSCNLENGLWQYSKTSPHSSDSSATFYTNLNIVPISEADYPTADTVLIEAGSGTIPAESVFKIYGLK